MSDVWAGRRVYGSDPDGPDRGAQEGRTYVELVAGPLDGLLLDVTGWPAQEVVDGELLMSDHGAFGPEVRSGYEPAELGAQGGGGARRFVWRGDIP